MTCRRPPCAPEADQHLFFDGVYHGEPVRIAALRASGGFVVQVGETLNKRNRLVKEILLAGLIPTLLVAGVSIALAWAGVARGLQPLERVRNHLLGRPSGDLSPIPETQAPIEILPVVDAFNRLLGQLRLANELQQRFLANAAHQLRTPLAGLQMHLELLLRRDLPPDTRAEVGRMHGATARAGHLAEPAARPGPGRRWIRPEQAAGTDQPEGRRRCRCASLGAQGDRAEHRSGFRRSSPR